MGPRIQDPLDHASALRLSRQPNRLWRIERMTFDTTAPSGVALAPDGRTLYISENNFEPSGTRELRTYPLADDGTLGTCTVLLTFGRDYRGVQRGVDGLCVDRDGNLVACAGWQRSGPGPRVYVLSPASSWKATRCPVIAR